jgi:hypothetical protein
MLLSNVLSASTFRGEPGLTGIVTVTGVNPVATNVAPSLTQLGGGTSSTTMTFNLPVAPTVSLNGTPVVVVNPNVSPSITNSGTNGNSVYQFSIPRAPVVSLGSVSLAGSGQDGNVTSTTSGAGDVAFNFVVPPGLVWRSTWAIGTAYYLRDVVQRLGSSYVCILANTGNAPPNATYWELLATSGAVGASGGGSDQIFWQNDKTITANYTVAATINASSSGTITIADGITVTVADGAEWSIV